MTGDLSPQAGDLIGGGFAVHDAPDRKDPPGSEGFQQGDVQFGLIEIHSAGKTDGQGDVPGGGRGQQAQPVAPRPVADSQLSGRVRGQWIEGPEFKVPQVVEGVKTGPAGTPDPGLHTPPGGPGTVEFTFLVSAQRFGAAEAELFGQGNDLVSPGQLPP